jgi:glycine betaine/proline transport system permease protein
LFGFGPVAAMIATIIYAMPPMVRTTILGLQRVSEEVVEFGQMAGCSSRQLLWKVMMPSARPTVMVGVNQVIMLSLNMVIIASMIGAGGLGFDVLFALRKLDIGVGLEAGVAIVVLAISMDRLSQEYAKQQASRIHISRHLTLLNQYVSLLLIAGGTLLLGMLWAPLHTFPESLQVTTAPFWDALVNWINLNLFDYLDGFKNIILLNLLIPFKRFLLAVPWPVTIGLIAYLGHRLGGWRLGMGVLLLSLFLAVNGLWGKAMVTVYLCGMSVLFAAILGIPLGLLAAENERAHRVLMVLVDTLQTLPSFVYLMPVVMLFRVGDFAAMIAVVAYAIAPAIRYTDLGIRKIPQTLIEAATTSGCTKRQMRWKVKFPLAFPEIMLGINQTVVMALSMLVITALVGTRELGQETYIALTKADTGRGLVAGVAIACIAMIVDRLISAFSLKRKQQLGLT